MASQTVLLAVYGLPGAGKTSLIHRLISALPNHAQPLIPIHICYDSILPKEIDFQDSEDTIWKNMRQLILDCIEYYECFDDTLLPWQTNPDYREKWQIVKEMIQTSKKDSKRCLYILDDNFYYRSMRYKIYQLAKKHAWGYGQIWVKCPLEVAFRRNCNRVVPVAQATITKMDSKLEVANSSKFPWEDNNFIFESINEDPDNWKMLLDFTIDTFSKPVVFISSTDELQKEKDRSIIANNFLHQADKILRKLVSQSIQQYIGKVGKINSQNIDISKEFNDIRKDIMTDLRRNSNPQLYQVECTNTDELPSLLNRIYTERCLMKGHK